jgi:hypothetical protein
MITKYFLKYFFISLINILFGRDQVGKFNLFASIKKYKKIN